jgi:lipopolysaccharide transport system permease protein
LLNPVRRVARKISTPMQGLLQKLLQLLPIPQPWWAKLDLLKILVQRDLEARYKGSVMGNLWPLLNQLAQLLVYTYVFSIVLKVKLNLKGLPVNDVTFGLWLFAGLIPWIAFSSGLAQSAGAVIGQPNLVKKVVFPLVLLPLVPICTAFVESSFGLMALVVMIALITHTIHGTLWLLPLIWIPQLLLTAGLGYLVAGFTVFLRDIPQTIGIILNLWFYVTPIMYPSSAVPEQLAGWIGWVNPMFTVVDVYRDLILTGEFGHGLELAQLWVVSALTFGVGVWVYRRLRPAFADVL